MNEAKPPLGSATTSATGVRTPHRDLSLDDLAYLNRMTTVGQVLPNVAHDLNNALQIIGGLVEILASRASLPEDVREKLTRIGLQSARATEMIGDLVTFARREDAGVRLVDVGKVVNRALTFRRYHLTRARIATTVGSPSPAPALARVEASAIHQIILNLIINAEHSLAGRTDGRIDVGIGRTDAIVEVRISDNGTGVPPEITGRVAEPFFTTKEPAAGLGLTVARGLASEIGGALTLRENPGGGTTALLTVPAGDGDARR